MRSDNRTLSLLLTVSAALALVGSPVFANDPLVKTGLVRAYSCQEGAVALATIHGLAPFGFKRGALFIETHEFSEFDVDGFAGYVWSNIENTDSAGPFERLELVYEGDPRAVDVHFCFLKNGSPFNVTIPLSKFERREDENRVTVSANVTKGQIKGATPRDHLQLTTLRVELHKFGSKHQSVTFGDVRIHNLLNKVEPVAVLTTVVNGDSGCQLRQTCN